MDEAQEVKVSLNVNLHMSIRSGEHSGSSVTVGSGSIEGAIDIVERMLAQLKMNKAAD